MEQGGKPWARSKCELLRERRLWGRDWFGVVASKRIDAEAEHGRGVAWVFFAGEGVDKAAAGGLVGLAADDEGSDLVGIALQESDELGAMERDGAGLTTLGDLKTDLAGSGGWALGYGRVRAPSGGCPLPSDPRPQR